MWKTARFLGLIVVMPGPVSAQATLQDGARANTVLVTASATVETPPDIATLTVRIRGEGKTPDAATMALAAKQSAIFSGLRGIDPKLELRTGDIAIRERRTGDCSDRGSDDEGASVESMADSIDAAADQLDTMASTGTLASPKGVCRMTGHVASSETTVRLADVAAAGTAVGLAGRLGAASAQIESFALRDDAAPGQRALTAAMANARAQAAALATASGSRLGPVVAIMRADPNARNHAAGLAMYAMAAQAAAPPPVVVAISPSPVETTAQIAVTFALLP